MGRVANHNTESLKALMLDALRKCNGVIMHATAMCGVSGTEHRKWMKTDPDYAEKATETRETGIDEAESLLVKWMRCDEGKVAVPAILFYLRTQAKHRGYVISQETTQKTPEGEAVIFKINDQEVKLAV